MRIGQGLDVHARVPDRKLVLGGVHIRDRVGLEGRSDADVLRQALCVALLGAAGLGDIGGHYPDSDAQYSEIDSRRLVRDVAAKLAARKFRIVNVDATVIAQAPRLAPHFAAMKTNIAADLGVAEGAVNLKATTTEGLGFTGRSEGIGAMAVALIEER
jgi:2-C-methyl-D-erythritol 2,4-cyclodiphosphate synthase